jgi:negative regulator of sigma E activity
MYLVESETLRMLRDDSDRQLQLGFDGVVGSLDAASKEKMIAAIAKHAQVTSDENEHPLWNRTKNFLTLASFTCVAAVILAAIIGSISKFQSGSRTTAAS